MNKQNTNQADALFEGLLQKRDVASLRRANASVMRPVPPVPNGVLAPAPTASGTDWHVRQSATGSERDTLKDSDLCDAVVEGEVTVRVADDWADDEATTVFTKPRTVEPPPAMRRAQLPPSLLPPPPAARTGHSPSVAPSPPAPFPRPSSPSSTPAASMHTQRPIALESRSGAPAPLASRVAPAMRPPYAVPADRLSPVYAVRSAPSIPVERPSSARPAVSPLHAAPTLELPARAFTSPPPNGHSLAPAGMPRFASEPSGTVAAAAEPTEPFGKARWLYARIAGTQLVNRLLFAAGILLVAAGAVSYILHPRDARAVIVVTGSGNVPLDHYTLDIDGRPSCSGSPCSLSLEPGLHGLRAQSKGYTTYEQKIAVTPGSEVALHITLENATTRAELGHSEPPRIGAEGGMAPAQDRDVGRGLPAARTIDPETMPMDRSDAPRPAAIGAGNSNSNARLSRVAPSPRGRVGVPEAKGAEATDGTCTLNLNSIPASNVLVDGRPYGSTPKMGVPVAAGAHTVLFVQPDGPREVQTVSCKGGESQTVAARLKSKD